MSGLLGRVFAGDNLSEGVASVESALKLSNNSLPLLHGLYGSSFSLLISAWFDAHKKTALIVTPDRESALTLADDLESWLGSDQIVYLPQQEVVAFDRNSPDSELVGAFLDGLQRIKSGKNLLVVTSLYGFRQRIIQPEQLQNSIIKIIKDTQVNRDQLCEKLTQIGYRNVSMVTRTGEYARRGGLIDIFPPGENPVRVEFFDDEVLSLRKFNVQTQRSLGKINAMDFLPVSHLILDDDAVVNALLRLENSRDEISHSDMVDLEARFEERLHSAGLEAFFPWFAQTATLSNYFSESTPIFWFNPVQLSKQNSSLDDEIPRMREARLNYDPLLPQPEKVVAPVEEVASGMNQIAVAESWIAGDSQGQWGGVEPQPFASYETRTPGITGGNTEKLVTELTNFEKSAYKTLLLCDNQGQADRLSDLLLETPGNSAITLPITGQISGGFVWPDAKIACVTDHEFFERYRRPTRTRFHGTAVVKESGTLKPGEFVVHIDYGVGRYKGLRKIDIQGFDRECLLLEFADNDKVFVPVEKIGLVERYSNDRNASPDLSRLGTASWARVTKKARKSIQAIAADLINLYATRKATPGFAFPSDTDLLQAMESSFIYTETPDQLTAINDVKRDMEKTQPMDRLICGDVGYGKTEVAMRAAFKAVTSGKQVALLCPTTLLASQHRETFAERFRDFPAKVAVISRFQSSSEQKEIIRRSKEGKIDVLIGTHRLFSRDIQFKDLGLLIIDEEHRFGVKHKERLKQLRKQVDVLTMSATPIPRTLYMSLMGARDLSLINTPPGDRLPIKTELCTFSDEVLTEAITRELHRGGQVFFVHNRVETIQAVAANVRDLLPDVRVCFAHGQMKENELEKVMTNFVNHQFDVLVTTTIIESGLDMPRVNTIIIDRADKFGLSQLYQIRGRVGRSSQRAFAYLMTPPGEQLTSDARRRLSALEEFQALGSGYHIAMRDLEIRGAGNLLGQQQSGHMEAIGFDLYCRLLDETIRELKGGDGTAVPEVRVELGLSAYLPDDYIDEPAHKMDMYRRLARIRKEKGFTLISEEMNDRYGHLPQEVTNLVDIYRLRLLAGFTGVEEVRKGKKAVSLFFASGKEPSPVIIRALMGTGIKGLAFQASEQFVIKISTSENEAFSAAYAVLDLIDRLRKKDTCTK
jgi:transcription-repair coupling factor (superfamily II helicase)